MKATSKPIKRVKVPPMSDAKFMTAKEKGTVLQQWARFVKGGFRLEDFTKGLYDYLTLKASFIAHFNRGGFYDTYFANPVDTLRFLDQFDRSKGCVSVEYGYDGWFRNSEYKDLNDALVDLIAKDLLEIRRKLYQGVVSQAEREAAAATDKLTKAKSDLNAA